MRQENISYFAASSSTLHDAGMLAGSGDLVDEGVFNIFGISVQRHFYESKFLVGIYGVMLFGFSVKLHATTFVYICMYVYSIYVYS